MPDEMQTNWCRLQSELLLCSCGSLTQAKELESVTKITRGCLILGTLQCYW